MSKYCGEAVHDKRITLGQSRSYPPAFPEINSRVFTNHRLSTPLSKFCTQLLPHTKGRFLSVISSLCTLSTAPIIKITCDI